MTPIPPTPTSFIGRIGQGLIAVAMAAVDINIPTSNTNITTTRAAASVYTPDTFIGGLPKGDNHGMEACEGVNDHPHNNVNNARERTVGLPLKHSKKISDWLPFAIDDDEGTSVVFCACM